MIYNILRYSCFDLVKNMKRHFKIIIIAVVIAALAAVTVVIINANINPDVKVSGKGEILTKDDSADETDSAVSVSEDKSNEGNEVDLKLEKIEKMEKLYEDNVKKAAVILKKHGITEEPDKDLDTEIKIALTACDKLENNEFSNEEKPVIEMYLEYRYFILDEYNESLKDTHGKLAERIRGLLDKDKLMAVRMGLNVVYDEHYADK